MEPRAGALRAVIACVALAACTPELDWRELSVPEGRFAVLLPGKAQRDARVLDTPAGALTVTLHSYKHRRGSMGVAYTDYPAAALAADQGRAQVDAARDALLRNIGAGAYSEETVAISGIPARQVFAEGRAGAQDALLKARFVLVGARLYQIAYIGERDGVAMADIDLFLTSFKLLR